MKNGSTPLVIHVRLCRATFLSKRETMPDIADALFEDRTGTIISLEVTPGAKKESFPSGYNTWRNTIGCSVTAHAIGGKANRAVITLISERLGIPATRVTIRSGSTNSQKRVHIREIDKGDLLIRLQALTG